MTNAAIVGIRFWAHTRDPEGTYFVSYDGASGFSMYSRNPDDPRQVRDILIEDCHFHSYRGNVLTSHYDSGAEPIARFVVRRSIISRNFSTNSHSQGLWFGARGQPLLPAILLEENLFDHNGWRIQQHEGGNSQNDGQATIFNHNTYFARASGVLFTRNIFMRPSSIGNKWTSTEAGQSDGIVLDNNLYVDGEIGISMGGNDAGPWRFSNIVVRNNVFTDIGRSRPTDRGLSWGLDVMDWDNGVVQSNLFVNQNDTDITNTWALLVQAEDATRDVVVSGNVIAGLHAGDSAPPLRLMHGQNMENVHLADNIVHSDVENPAVRLIPGNYIFSGVNHYDTQRTSSSRFQVDGIGTDLSDWIDATGDTGATLEAPSFTDPNRNLETYVGLLGLGSNYQDFIDGVYAQSKADWDPALTAGAINHWFREGFAMSESVSPIVFRDRFEQH